MMKITNNSIENPWNPLNSTKRDIERTQELASKGYMKRKFLAATVVFTTIGCITLVNLKPTYAGAEYFIGKSIANGIASDVRGDGDSAGVWFLIAGVGSAIGMAAALSNRNR